jgi:hypothetical protein
MAHRVRIQIQGKDMKPEISQNTLTDYIINKAEGMAILNDLWEKLNSTQQKTREIAYQEARSYIGVAPTGGIPTQGKSRSFYGKEGNIRDAPRIDIEVNGGCAFSNDRHIVYILFKGNDLGADFNWHWDYDANHIPTKSIALAGMEKLWGQLSAQQRATRASAYNEAQLFIKSRGISGIEGFNTIYDFASEGTLRGEKITFRIDKGCAFSD